MCHTLLDFLEIIVDQNARSGPIDVAQYRPEANMGTSPSGAFLGAPLQPPMPGDAMGAVMLVIRLHGGQTDY